MGASCSIRPSSEISNPINPCAFRFLDAAARGNVTDLAHIMAQRADIDACDRSGRTALHLACAEGHTSAVEFLISQGSKVTVRDRWGREPLDEAIHNGHTLVVSTLHKAGARLSDESRSEYEDRMRCHVSGGNLNALKRLVDGGMSTLCVDYLGRSLLHLAVELRHIQIVESE